MNLRKEKGWSQEEFASYLDVSRQSVSKWELGTSLPELDKIVKISKLFDVSIDYLVNDENYEISYVNDDLERRISEKEVNEYLDLVEKASSKISLGIMLCIYSPIVLLLLCGIYEFLDTRMNEGLIAGLGVSILLVIVAYAVHLFILYGLKLNRFEYLEKEKVILDYNIKRDVDYRKKTFEPVYRKYLSNGIILCIVSVIPLMLSICFENYEFMCILALDIMLIIIGIGVYKIVKVGMIKGSYDKLLQIDDYTIDRKYANKKLDGISGIYWCSVTALYLAVSFIFDNWHKSWIIWPIAGVIFGIVSCIVYYMMKEK